MEAIQAYLSAPSSLESSVGMLRAAGLEQVLVWSAEEERYPAAAEAVDRAFLDPQALLWAYRELGVEGIRRLCGRVGVQTRLMQGIHRIQPDDLVAVFERIEDLFSLLCTCLSTGETGTVDPIISSFLSLSRNPAPLCSPTVLSLLSSGLSCPNDTNKVRFCDLIVRLSISSPALYQAYSALLDQILALYQTDDLLLKLTLVDIITSLGDSPHTLNHLLHSSAFGHIAQELESAYAEDYVKGRVMVLFARAAEAANDMSILTGRFWQVLNGFLSASDLAKFNAATTSLYLIVGKTEGITALLARETTLQILFSLVNSPISDKRLGLYSVLTQAVSCGLEDQARSLYSRLPVPASGRSVVCAELRSPFAEFQEPCFRLLKSLSRFNWALSACFGEPELAEILLTRRSTHSSVVCTLKFEIIEAAHKSSLPFTQLLRARIGEYVAAGVFAPAMGLVEEAISEPSN